MKKIISWILIVIGCFMVMAGIFNFKARDLFTAPAYYYTEPTIIGIALGMAALILGILLYRERRK